MDNLQLLDKTLGFIEENLFSKLKIDDIAAYCYCSKSSIEKLFKNVNNISVHDYIVRRKMVIAAKILQSEEINLLELALSLGYNSNEAFTRAFRQVWNCNPSEYTQRYHFAELFPRFRSIPRKGEFSMEKSVDISEMYDLFMDRKDCYFVCSDIQGMTQINEISYKAGDLAILEAMKRISDAIGENDVMFRIGGDEFVVLTNSNDIKYAESIAELIQKKNGAKFQYEDQEVPLGLHVSMTRSDSKVIKYDELFQKLHKAIVENKVK